MHLRAAFAAGIATAVLATGCAGEGSQSAMPRADSLVTSPTSGASAGRSMVSSAAVQATPSFFNGQLVSIFIIPLSPSAAQQVLAHNKNVNLIFEATGFIPVINEIQGPGFNPLWEVVDIAFNARVTPQQFTSQAQILAAQAANQITLTFTNQVDSVPVVGSAGK